MLVITGPTASGKTGKAVALAQAISGEIISADSRQLYRGMDLGTGKDLDEYGSVPYHMIDICDAGYKYNLYEYLRDYQACYDDITSRGKPVILCGGTGMYVESVVKGIALPPVPENRELRQELSTKSLDELTVILKRYKTLRNNSNIDTCKRAIRAIEIAFYKEEHPLEKTGFQPKKTFFIGTVVSREERNARIDRRLAARLDEGLVEEVQGLLDKGIPAETLLRYGLEYKFVTEHLLGLVDREGMQTLLATAIHQFAKRQMTFFRGMESKGVLIHWTDPAAPGW